MSPVQSTLCLVPVRKCWQTKCKKHFLEAVSTLAWSVGLIYAPPPQNHCDHKGFSSLNNIIYFPIMSKVSSVIQYSRVFFGNCDLRRLLDCGAEGKTDKYMNAAASRLRMLLFINISTAYLVYQKLLMHRHDLCSRLIMPYDCLPSPFPIALCFELLLCGAPMFYFDLKSNLERMRLFLPPSVGFCASNVATHS